MSSIIPFSVPSGGMPDRMDVRPLAYVLDNSHPDLWALALRGESDADALARREAALDIADELRDEYDAATWEVAA